MLSSPVAIRGGGVAALCCAALLARRGVEVDLASVRRREVTPVVILDAVTAGVLEEIFDGALHVKPRQLLETRLVNWSSSEPPAQVPSRNLVISESDLLQSMREALLKIGGSRVRVGRARAAVMDESRITILAAGRAPAKYHRFGRRRVTRRIIRPSRRSDPGVSTMIADGQGWTYRAPLDGRRLLEQRVVVPLTSGVGVTCAPRLCWPPCAQSWFACGPSAMLLDPICGDGVGHAARSAIWLCGLLTAPHNGAPAQVQADYSARIAMAFRSHLAACLSLYSEARFAATWHGELSATERGLAALDKLLAGLPPLQNALAGFDAVPCVTLTLAAKPDQPGAL